MVASFFPQVAEMTALQGGMFSGPKLQPCRIFLSDKSSVSVSVSCSLSLLSRLSGLQGAVQQPRVKLGNQKPVYPNHTAKFSIGIP